MIPDDHSIHEVDYESTPLSRSEYITAIVHLYRGELTRATSWRMRLDATTNWAVLTTAGILSLSFGSQSSSHVIVLLGFALIAVFWAFEARRYRFADIWYARVRKIEENFYGPILRRDTASPSREWGALVASDLFSPKFKITRLGALRSRLLRNYWAIFLVQLLAWIVKVAAHPTAATTWAEVETRLQIGVMPWWSSVALVGGFFLGLILLVVFTPRPEGDEHDHWSATP